MSENKRIVICLDGTWQNPYKMRQRDDGGKVLKPTNVLKLGRAVLPRNPGDQRPQITYYDAGIGALVKYPGRANPADHPQLVNYRPKGVIEFLREIDDLDAFLTGIGIDPEENPLPGDVLAAVQSS